MTLQPWVPDVTRTLVFVVDADTCWAYRAHKIAHGLQPEQKKMKAAMKDAFRP